MIATPTQLDAAKRHKAFHAAIASAAAKRIAPTVMPAIVVAVADILVSAQQPPQTPEKIQRREYDSGVRSLAYIPISKRILYAVAREFEMTIEEMISRQQEPKFTIPRFVAIGLMLEMTMLSLPAIGRQLGGRDHTSIMNGRSRIERLLMSEAFRNRFDEIKAEIGE